MSLTMMGLDLGPLVRVFFLFLWIWWLFQYCRLWHFCSDWNWVNWWQCYVGSLCIKRSRVQMWLTHRNIKTPKILIYHFVSHSFKPTFKNIVVLCLCHAHSIYCSFTTIISRKYPVGAIYWPFNSGSGNKDWPKFICCVDGQQAKVHTFWTIEEDFFTP